MYGADSSPERIAQHYSARSEQTVEQRERSPIIHLKKLNNWVKSVVIGLHGRPGDRVLDLACGKGGDLRKWSIAKAGYYVGVDIAEGSIKDCTACHKAQPGRRFPARLICADCYEAPLDELLREDAPFDVCSCQFALHYSWSTEARARQALANVSALLRPGGSFIGTMPDADVILGRLRESGERRFGNAAYSIAFDAGEIPVAFGAKYEFHLEDAVDCPEWLVLFHLFTSLAEEYGLELLLVRNFGDFVHEYMREPKYAHLMRKLGALDGLPQDEWEVACLYLAFVLRKRPSDGTPEKHIQFL